jgi:hypothetical protein
MDLHLTAAMLDQLDQPALRAAPEPGPDRCCETVRTASP